MDSTTTSHDFKLLEIVETGRRRRFTREAKRRIVEESNVCGDSVSAVARRHGLFPAQLFAWRRAARENSFGIWCGAGDGSGFVEAQVVPEPRPTDRSRPRLAAHGGGQIEVVSANGRQVIVDRDVDVEVLLRIIQGLETLR